MRMEMNLIQTQTITPQMIATLNILQYGAPELREYLSELSYENPLLELSEKEPPKETQQPPDRLKWLRANDRQNRNYYDDAGKTPEIPDQSGGSLRESLDEQLMGRRLPPGQTQSVRAVLELLDEHGLLDSGPEEIGRACGLPVQAAQEAVRIIQSLEPAGVGARNLQESLLLQLRRKRPESPIAEKLLEQYFKRLGSWQAYRFAEAMKCSEEAVQQALTEIRSLNPYPADGFSAQRPTVYIRPDLYIAVLGERLEIWENEELLPSVALSQEYLTLMKTTEDPETRKYLRTHYAQAEQIIRNVVNRNTTMLRCAEVIARLQEAFFRGGALRTMTLKTVAEELDVHESTVSRTVRDKYIQCDRGIFAMSDFFCRSAGQNGSLTRLSIQDILKQLIGHEDRKQPLKDDQLQLALEQQGIRISRRTVAKYRGELGIPTASNRKVHDSNTMSEKRTERGGRENNDRSISDSTP